MLDKYPTCLTFVILIITLVNKGIHLCFLYIISLECQPLFIDTHYLVELNFLFHCCIVCSRHIPLVFFLLFLSINMVLNCCINFLTLSLLYHFFHLLSSSMLFPNNVYPTSFRLCVHSGLILYIFNFNSDFTMVCNCSIYSSFYLVSPSISVSWFAILFSSSSTIPQ